MHRFVLPAEHARRSGSRRVSVARLRTRYGAVEWIEREALLVTAVVAYAAALIWHLPKGIRQDTWLALVGGREIVEHGLPHRDVLTVWGQGAPWTDQPWLAQVAFYGLEAVGGIALSALVATLATLAAFALAVATGRRLGGSSRSVLWILLPAGFLLALSSWHLRAQSFAYPLFAGLLWLLLADSRRNSRQVYLVIPVLVVWANVHGSVVIGAALAVLYGVTFAVGHARRGVAIARYAATTLLLVVGAPLSVFVSPYGPGLVDYYERTLLSPAFRDFVSEWQPLELGPVMLPFFALLFVGLWLLGRATTSRPRPFDTLAFALVALAPLAAVRNLVWFALAAIAILPSLLEAPGDAVAPSRRHRRLNLALVATAAACAAVVGVTTLARSGSWLETHYPDAAAAAVAAASGPRPEAKVFADEKYADWLLWRIPGLRGRIALDVRFELLERSELRALYDLRNGNGQAPLRAVREYNVLVLDRRTDSGAIEAVAAERSARTIYADKTVVVISRG